jgi:hypothetical protein
MSPYQQAVTDVQKQAAVREAQLAQQQTNLGAARQGTYGGARQAIAQAERERGLLDRLSSIQAEGGQKAFDAARQAQQFGSTLGLQGLQTGLQGMQQLGQAGATLGQLGTQRQTADLQRLGAQETVGAQQRAFQQQQLDQAYADFLRQRDYPMEQLGYFSNLMRGIPIGLNSTQTAYAAPPSIASQVGGLGMAGYSLGKLTGQFAQGGLVDSYAVGGSISPEELDSFTDRMSDQQLQMKLATTKPGSYENLMVAGELQARDDVRKKAMATQGGQRPVVADLLTGGAMPPMPAQMPQQMAALPEDAGGVAALPAPNMENMEPYTAAAGGLVAFEDGGQVARFQAGGAPLYAEGNRPFQTTPGQRRREYTQEELDEFRRLKELGVLGSVKEFVVDPVKEFFSRGSGRQDLQRGISQEGALPADVRRADMAEMASVPLPAAVTPAAPAPGGIEAIAAQDAGKKDLSPAAVRAAATPLSMDAAMAQATGLMGGLPTGSAFADIKAEMKQASEERKAELKDAAYMRLAEFGLGMAAGTSPYFAANVGKAGVEALKGYADDLRQKKKLDADDRKILTDIKRMERADERDNVIKTAEIGTRIFGEMSANDRARLAADVQERIAGQQLKGQQMEREASRFESQKSTALKEAEDAVAKAMAKDFALAQDPVAQDALRTRLYQQFLRELMKPKDQVGQTAQAPAGTTLRFDAKGNPIQ